MRVDIELVGIDDIDKINKIDGPALAHNAEAYVKENRLNTYIVVNSWLLITRQYSKYGWVALKDAILTNGLVDTIKCSSTFADAILKGVRIPGLFSGIYHDVENYVSYYAPLYNSNETITHDPLATILMICRFPKRYSPLKADILEENSIAEFRNLEREHWLRFQHRERSSRMPDSCTKTRAEYSPYLISRLRDTMSSLMDWDGICNDLETIQDVSGLALPTGACADAYATVGSKLKVLSIYAPEYFTPSFGQTMIWPCDKVDRTVPPESVLVAAVPKSYKKARVIAMEETIRQMKAHKAFMILDRYLPSNVNLHDQRENAYLAQHGSLFNDLATIDMSSASDSITRSLAWSLFPARFRLLIEPLLGTYVTYDGEQRFRMCMLSTSGNNLTFWLESVIFLCIDTWCADICQLFGVDVQTYTDGLAIPHVYGDDQVISTTTYETVADVMDILDLHMNREKSYYEGPFRESCGGDYYHGIPVQSYYFPRFSLVGKISKERLSITNGYRRDGYNNVTITSIESMVALQHRLYYVAPDASRFIYEILKEAFPEMTTSSPMSETFDCWGYDDTYTSVPAPYGVFEDRTIFRTIFAKPEIFGVERRLQRIKNEQTRTKKFRSSVKFVLKRELTAYERQLFEAYKYAEFLKHGPRYENPLMELLGISQRPSTIEEIFGTPTAFARLEEIDYR